MLSRRIGVVLGLLLGLFAYFYLAEEKHWAFIPGCVLLGLGVVVYTFQHQIDWLWYQKHPPALPPEIVDLFSRTQGVYRQMSDEERADFGRKVSLFVHAKDFIPMGPDHIAEELKYIVAFSLLLYSQKHHDFLLKRLERFVFYLHPFLSPHMPDKVHVYELQCEEGIAIFSIEQLLAGFIGKKHYDVGVHVGALAYSELCNIAFDEDRLPTWEVLEQIGGQSREAIETYTGMQQESSLPVTCHHYFHHASKFQELDKEAFSYIEETIMRKGRVDV